MNKTADAQQLVLVVEDEAIVALETCDVLERAGYQVALQPGPPIPDSPRGFAAAVVNLGLGGRDGRDVIRQLRARHPGLPVVVVTGFHPRSEEADLRGLGGPTARLDKPVRPEQLIKRLVDAITSGTGVA